jgi:apolipoprotein N-acyltransferase
MSSPQVLGKADGPGGRPAGAPMAAASQAPPLAGYAGLARKALALGSGALLACAFAPLEWWPLAIVCPAVLMWLWEESSPREAAWLGFWFSFGTFATGCYWLCYGLTRGGAPPWMTAFLVLGLVGIMALYHAATGYVVARWLPRRSAWRWLLGMPAAWLLIEWWRGWFLSGFPWLSLGYSQTDSWLARLAPLGGVYGISLALLVMSGALIALARGDARARLAAAAALILPWTAAAALGSVRWTHPAGPALSVAVVQANVPAQDKWLPQYRERILRRYQRMTESALGTKLIVWPEASLPDLANNLLPYIEHIDREARAHGSALVMGVLRASADGERYYNAILALGQRASWYAKDHLVPFAEFFPVPKFVRNWLRLMNLPYSDFTRGGSYQPPLPVAGLELGPTVCYEVAYGSYMLHMLPRATALVNVTDDAWFGRSWASWQQFQMARMRTQEEGRYMVVSTDDGISAVIGPRGGVRAQAPLYRPYVLRSSITPMTGLTPYARVGNWLAVGLAAAGLACALGAAELRRRAGMASATPSPPRSPT